MKREISGTSVATAVLLLAAAVLLCTRLESLDAPAIKLPVLAALLTEGAVYAGIIYVWSGRFSLRAELVCLPTLLLLRIAVSAAAAVGAELAAARRPHIGWDFLSPGWESWMTAAAFAVIAVYLVRGALMPPERAPAERRAHKVSTAQPTAAKVAFDSPPAQAGAGASADAEDAGRNGATDASLFQVLDPRDSAQSQMSSAPPMPQVEGWVTVPASLIAEQLPPDAQLEVDEVTIPLSRIMPRLREGEVRIPLVELDDVVSRPAGAADDAASIELPLPAIVPLIPDEAFDLPQPKPPSWLAADAALEDIFFAKV
ncbi:MAG: hypothetical protein JSV65_09710 [Armatimonadota bacterium]|nr:MAG: hypothetical protein JSV65_09710 [Armatimonadota bacterium]